MVEVGTTATLIIKDTGLVCREDGFVSLDSDRDDALLECLLDGINILGRDHGLTSNLNTGGVVVKILAATVLLGYTGGVGVGFLVHLTMGLSVFEGRGWVTTIAAEGELDAINKLLFSELEELVGTCAVCTFNSGGGAESPA